MATADTTTSTPTVDELHRASRFPSVLVGLAGWALPGLGYALIGQAKRGLIAGITILLLFVSGLAIGGVRVVDVPGYTDEGNREMVVTGRAPNGAIQQQWSLTSRPAATLLGKSWYLGQILAGPVALVASVLSVNASAAGYPQGTAQIEEVATLYCAVAGMLNLVVLMDAAHRAQLARTALARRGRRR